MDKPNSNPPRNIQVNPWLKRVARISAWALFAGVIVLVLSGWGITQTGVIYKITFGLVDRRLADSIHKAANGPLAFFFLLHVFINIRLSIRNKSPSATRLIDWVLIVIGGCILGIIVYMQYFRLGG